MKKQRIGCVGWLFPIDTEYGKTTAVCDINEDIVGKYVDKHPDAAGFTDYREMAAGGLIDLAIIASPNALHREMAECFLEQNVDVFLEKPMGVNRVELDSILAAWQASDAHLAIDFELRISFIGRRVKELLEEGAVGRPVGVEFIHHRGAWLAEGNGVWRTDPVRSGGLYFMEVCHEIDLFRHWFGDITAVQSFANPNVLPQYPPSMPDNVCTHLWFADGVRGTIQTSHTSSVYNAKHADYGDQGHDMYFIITGTDGALRIDCIGQRILVCRYAEFHPDARQGKRVELERIEDYTEMAVNEFHHDISGNIARFVESMAKGEAPHQDALDAWKTHLVCLAAEESAVNDSRRMEIKE